MLIKIIQILEFFLRDFLKNDYVSHARDEVGLSSMRGGPALYRQMIQQTTTLPLEPDKQIDKIEVLSAAGIIADAIDAVFEDTSVSDIFGGQNQH